MRFYATAICVLLLSGTPAFAHDPPEGSTVFTAPIPSLALGGAVTFATLIGPDSGLSIVHSSLDLTFHPSGSSTAKEVELIAAISVDGVQKHWRVTGAQLGWGTGPGPSKAVIDSDVLLGQVDVSAPFGGSIISLTIRSVTGGGLSGRFSNSALRLTLSGALRHDVPELPASQGGTQQLALDAGAGHAGETDLLVGSWSGSTPGTAIGS